MKICITVGLLFFSSFLFCQTISIPDISGKWNGYRYQFNDSKTSYQEDFNYTYRLSQEENKVIGVVKISRTNGDFAEIAVRGFVEDKKFYFEEYEVLNARRSNGIHWCLKTGVLDIAKNGLGEEVLKGNTRSIQEGHAGSCTGGYSYLTKKVLETQEGAILNADQDIKQEYTHSIDVYPNPFTISTNISFKLPVSNTVSLDVVDINGNVVANLLSDQVLNQGRHSYEFSLANQSSTMKFYYMRLSLGENTYTRILEKK